MRCQQIQSEVKIVPSTYNQESSVIVRIVTAKLIQLSIKSVLSARMTISVLAAENVAMKPITKFVGCFKFVNSYIIEGERSKSWKN